METLKDLIDKLNSESIEEETEEVVRGTNRKKVTKFCTDPDVMYKTIVKWYALASSITNFNGISLWMHSNQRLDIKQRGSEQFAIVYVDFKTNALLDETCIEERISKYIRS